MQFPLDETSFQQALGVRGILRYQSGFLTMGNPVLQVENLVMRYGEVQAVRGVSFSVLAALFLLNLRLKTENSTRPVLPFPLPCPRTSFENSTY
jgi:hypothetical protein